MSPASPLPQPRSTLVDVVVVGAGVTGAAAASPRYLRLAAEALPLWRELEAETGAQL